MSLQRISQIEGLNLYVNPLLKKDSQLIRAVNVTSDSYGAKTKRSGYNTFLGTANGSTPLDLFSYYKNDGTTFYLYRNSGGLVYYSAQGTGAWTIAANGTVTAGNHVGHAVLDNTLIIGDGSGSTRHTTNGTSFTDSTLAPIAATFDMFQNRIYAGGTSSSMFYSVTGDATNWTTTGTADSSSLTIPGAGKMALVFNANDRILAVKNSGKMFRWDGWNLVDMSTDLGPSSPYSYAKTEDYSFWMNRLGVYGYGGGKPELLSNAVQKQIYNSLGSAIVGTIFNTIPAVVHRYDYLAAIGTVTDDLTKETIGNCILKFDYNKNEWLNYQFANNPTAWLSYKDASGDQQLIWGASGGQCYKLSGTATTDNGTRIESVMEFLVYMGFPEYDKKWNELYVTTNPGCEAKVQVAYSDTYERDFLRWEDVGDCQKGANEFRLTGRSKMLFIKIYESSLNKPFTIYGISIDGEPIPH